MSETPNILRGFWIRVAAAALVFWSSLATWNVVVDPYSVFGVYLNRGFNHAKTLDARLLSALQLKNSSPQTLLLGSSRVWFFRDEVKRLGPRPMTYSLPALSAAEIAPLLDFFRSNTAVSNFYWGVDFFAFNAYPTGEVPSYGRLDDLYWLDFLLRNALSWRTAREGLRVIKRSELPATANIDLFFAYAPTQRLRNTLRIYLGPQLYTGYKFDPGLLASIEVRLKRLKEEGAAVTLFIGPLHGSLALAILATGNWNNFEYFKTALTMMAARLEVPIWDFAVFNSITTEPLGANSRWFHDPSHYEHKTAALMVDRFLATEQSNIAFGELLRPDTLSIHFERQRLARDNYLQQHPDVAALIRDVAAEIGVSLVDDLDR